MPPMLHKRAVLLLLAACVSFAAFGAEIPLSHPVAGPAAGLQYGPLVASDGDGYFVIWNDARFSGYQLRGTRLNREGQVLDGTGIPLLENTYQGLPYVTWTGSSYLVVWGQYSGNDTIGLRVDRDGKIIDGPRVIVSGATPLAVASNATHVAILYWDRRKSETRARLLTPEAAPAGDVFIRQGIHGTAYLAAAGSQFAAFWNEPSGSEEPVHISGIRFTAAGSLDAEPRLLVQEPHILIGAIASDGSSYLLLTGDSSSQRTQARRISGDFSTVGEAHLLPAGINTSSYLAPSLLWTGTSYKVVSTAGHNVIGAVLDRDGQPGEARTIEPETNGRTSPTPVVGTNGSELLIAWIGATDPEVPISNLGTIVDVYATIADISSLEPRSRSLVSISAPAQHWPRVASSGENLLAVWSEGMSTYARRLHRDGSWVDAEPLLLLDKAVIPSVVYNGAEYLVAWSETDSDSTIVTKRIPKDGALRAEAGASFTAPYASDISLAVAGNVTLLAWIGIEGVQAVRLDQQAALLDPNPVQVTEDPIEDIAASSDGSGRFLVVWSVVEERFGSPPIAIPIEIRGTRFDTNLTRLDGGLVIAASTADESEPAVTWNGSNWLVLWTRNHEEIRGRHVAADGTLVDGVVTDDGVLVATQATTARVTWDGSRYLAAWTTRTDGGYGRVQVGWLPRLGETVHVRDLGERPWFPSTDVGLAPLHPGAVAAVYTRIAREPQYGTVSRAFATVLELPSPRRRAVR
jgi:hypothetical protein